MSGVFGFWNLDGRPADPAVLAAMSNALAHRGRDGCGAWIDGSVAIGHRMLRVTPEAVHEVQPVISDDGSRVLTADLRLDNRDDLIRDGVARARRQPDADLLFSVVEEYGVETPRHLIGAFAWARWDARQRQLVCARDHFGEKPLYYVHIPGRLFAFASDVGALLTIPGVSDDVDELEIARHLMVPIAEDLGATYYAAVRRLCPAHVLVVTDAGVTEEPYWSLDPTRTTTLSSDGEYAEAVREAFTEAVRCRLRAAGPVASMLSGGLDSSSISCVAARLLRAMGRSGPLTTLSAIYPDTPTTDERRYIATVTTRYQTEAIMFEADRTSPIAAFPRINRLGGGANKGGNLYLAHTLYRQAARSGARVVLDGFDGDSTFTHGDGVLIELALSHRWWRLSHEVRAKAIGLGERPLPAVGSWIRRYGLAPALRRLPLRRTTTHPVTYVPPERASWAVGLAPEFARRLADAIVAPALPQRTDREFHARFMQRPVLLQALDWLEAVGAGAGVEVRVPFFDVRLVELCVSLPLEQKLRDGWSRYVMRQAMDGILPEEIRWRKDKSDIEPGFYRALRTHASTQLEALWTSDDASLAPYLDVDQCARRHARFDAGVASSQESFLSWRASSLALWLTGRHGAYTAHESTAARMRPPQLVGSPEGG